MTQHDGPDHGAHNTSRHQQQNPTQWSGQPPYAGGPYPPVPPGPAPKKANWFARHKILTGLCGLAAVVVIATAATASGGASDPAPTTAASHSAAGSAAGSADGSATGDSAAPAKSATSAKPTSAAAEPAKDTAPGIGDPVKSGNLQFTVTKVVRNQAQVGQDFMAQKAQGRFTLVYVTVRNVGNDSETLLDSEQKIKDADNKTYSPDSGAELVMADNDVWLAQINPGNAVDGILVYDMPVGVQATAIDFSGGLFKDSKTVRLH
ncbi:DUF4352 domain-containing protein [Flexivirga lutea]